MSSSSNGNINARTLPVGSLKTSKTVSTFGVAQNPVQQGFSLSADLKVLCCE